MSKAGGFPPALKPGTNKEDGKDPNSGGLRERPKQSLGELEDELAEDTKDWAHGQPVPWQMTGSKSSHGGSG